MFFLSKFQNETSFDFPSEETTKLVSNIQMINTFEFSHRNYTKEEFNKIWNEHLELAENELNMKNFQKSISQTNLAITLGNF